jgi:Ca2+-binding EF-hand superfamily protein
MKPTSIALAASFTLVCATAAAAQEPQQRSGGPGGPGGPGRGGPGMIIRAADADKNGEITTQEWRAWIDTLGADGSGVISAEKIVASMPPPPERPADAPQPPQGEGTRGGRRGGGNRQEMLTRALDRDQDGAIEVADLESLFTSLDKNGDGTLQREEAGGGRRGRGPGRV